jgi:glycosyltransferase involved in cell wall biosynthesis
MTNQTAIVNNGTISPELSNIRIMPLKLLVFDTHPVQYRVPIWQTLESNHPGMLHVVYASDCTVRGHKDAQFGQTVAWDEPMLTGYENTVLNCEKGEPFSSWDSFTGEGVKEILDKIKPDVVLLVGLNFKFDLVAYWHAKKRSIPIWLRCETQDAAITRSFGKAIFRSLLYRIAYLPLSKVFYIGELNKRHYLKHDVSGAKLKAARYGTVDRFENMSTAEKQQKRNDARTAAGISESSFVVGFSGKFIDKKHPEILFEMLQFLPDNFRKRIHLYFMGSGANENALKKLGEEAFEKYGVKTFFSGFINQTQLPGHYLAMDVMVLPSRRMGETWGLVANEAMQAGCGVVVSEAVGCSEDFKSWERFKIIQEENAPQLAKHIEQLALFSRDFDWARPKLKEYSLESTAHALAYELRSLSKDKT